MAVAKYSKYITSTCETTVVVQKSNLFDYDTLSILFYVATIKVV